MLNLRIVCRYLIKDFDMQKNIENEFEENAINKGYSPPIQKEWAINHLNETHSHDKDLFLFIQSGEMEIGIKKNTDFHITTLLQGDTMEVLAGTQHYEKAGKDGVIFLVAKK